MNELGEISAADMYREASITFRHYSSRVMKIQVLIIAQSLLAMTGAIFTSDGASFAFSCFGLLLLIALHIMKMNDQRHCDSLAESLLELEGDKGPFTKFKTDKKHREKWVFISRKVPFLFLLLVFICLCLISLKT